MLNGSPPPFLSLLSWANHLDVWQRGRVVATIPKQHLNQLHAVGLLVSEPFVLGHLTFQNGLIVGKPTSVSGHSLRGYEACWGLDVPMLDAPWLCVPNQGFSS